MPSGQITTLTWHIPGTLAADLAIRQKMQFDAQLIHVSAVSSNTAAAGLQIGTATDAEAYLVKRGIGTSGIPVAFTLANFVNGSSGAYPRITAGSALNLALDYDYNGGGSGSASANVTITLTLLVG